MKEFSFKENSYLFLSNQEHVNAFEKKGGIFKKFLLTFRVNEVFGPQHTNRKQGDLYQLVSYDDYVVGYKTNSEWTVNELIEIEDQSQFIESSRTFVGEKASPVKGVEISSRECNFRLTQKGVKLVDLDGSSHKLVQIQFERSSNNWEIFNKYVEGFKSNNPVHFSKHGTKGAGWEWYYFVFKN